MHRAVAATAATVLGVWLVLTFKSSPLPASNVAVAAGTTTTTTTTATTTTEPSARSGRLPPAGPAPPPSTTPTTLKTVDGDPMWTRYGDVQVEVVLRGSRIVDVRPLQMPFDHSRSQDISDQAAPLLRDEVLRAQSAQIDTIGGATYTTDGYARSLQSALDRARG